MKTYETEKCCGKPVAFDKSRGYDPASVDTACAVLVDGASPSGKAAVFGIAIPGSNPGAPANFSQMT